MLNKLDKMYASLCPEKNTRVLSGDSHISTHTCHWKIETIGPFDY